MSFQGRAASPAPILHRELRKERGLKQQEAAERFSVKLRTYQGYEYGGSYPEVAKLLAIADFFHVSLDYLMGLSDVRERQQAPSQEDNE